MNGKHLILLVSLLLINYGKGQTLKPPSWSYPVILQDNGENDLVEIDSGFTSPLVNVESEIGENGENDDNFEDNMDDEYEDEVVDLVGKVLV